MKINVGYRNARVMRLMNSEQDSYLASGSLAIAFASIESKARGIHATPRDTFGGALRSCASISATGVGAAKGGLPVMSSTAVQASAYSSVAPVGWCPVNNSGAA